MNEAISIQRSKLISAYGGVGSTIDTIDDLAYQVEPFDEWPIYILLHGRHANKFRTLLYTEERLIARLRAIGFDRLTQLFEADDFPGGDVKVYNVGDRDARRMVSAVYCPRWFYCPWCHSLKSIEQWENEWTRDANFRNRPPKCNDCSKTHGRKVFGPSLKQVRFMLASMETGDLRDIPWDKLYAKKGGVNATTNVWDFTSPITPMPVTFHVKKGSSDLIDIYVKSNNGVVVTMAEVMNKYFIIPDANNRPVVYRTVIRNANNVYFAYTISSVYIPIHEITPNDIQVIRDFVANGISDSQTIKNLSQSNLSVKEIEYIICHNFIAPPFLYKNEEQFRLGEFNDLTDLGNYQNSVYTDGDKRLESIHYKKPNNCNIPTLKNVFLLKRVNVTSALVAYSRIDKISPSCITNWRGTSENPKQWYDLTKNAVTRNVEVALHPTCKDIANVDMMPIVATNGEGFFIELDMGGIDEEDRATYVHTLSHLIMKELEFSCGYPISSMSERLYILPETATQVQGEGDKYGFMIYSANGEAGSYGGIASLFESGKIWDIFNQAIELAGECPNDPICEEEGGSCFACVQLPETTCEMFNSKLSRNIILKYVNPDSSQTTNSIQGSTQQTAPTFSSPFWDLPNDEDPLD